MKNKKTLKVLVLLVAIVLVSLIAFVGIYQYDKGSMKNILPEYALGKEVKGSRLITFKVDTTTKTSDTDSSEDATETENADETSEQSEENASKEVPVNATEVLNAENYQLSKNIIEKRLQEAKIEEYDIRVNEEDGKIILDMPDNTTTDNVLQFLMQQGDFNIIATDSEEVLLSKSDLEKSQVMYYSNEKGTTVYLNLKFKKDSTKKLEDVTKEYVETTAEDGTKTKKTITIKIDDEKLLTTYFGETISDGQIQIPIGDASNDNAEINENATNASYIAMILNNQTLPIVYTSGENQYVSPILDSNSLNKIIIVAATLVVLVMVYLAIRYKKNGILAAIGFVGYLAIVMLLIRFTNVPIALGSMSAILLSAIMEVIFLTKLLKDADGKKMDETIIKMTLAQIPLYVIAIVFCFVTWLPMVSFGTALFWGLIMETAYNYLIVKNLLKD